LLKGKVKLGAIDAKKYEFIALRYDVRGYPTLKVFDGNNFEKYEGKRSVESLVKNGLALLEITKNPSNGFGIWKICLVLVATVVFILKCR
jgi:protein disulfide-isomerase A6